MVFNWARLMDVSKILALLRPDIKDLSTEILSPENDAILFVILGSSMDRICGK